jgi:queuine tRNA-ribosyltransferase
MSHVNPSRLHFQLEATAPESQARAARFRTQHNEVLTPTFMPVGTHASVRTQRREDLLDCGVQVVLANTYHLLLRPGVELFEKFGGIHRFMNWPRSVLTDSGGFQIFCLPDSRSMQEEGAFFKSYVDGSTVSLSPERSIATQKTIGADIMMVLDQCVPSTVEKGIARAAMELTHRWAQRSLDARGDSTQALFGIVQGACYRDLRIESARVITQLPFDGFAIGGLAVGENASEREDCTAIVTELLPQDRPRYLMGVGTPLDLLEAVHRGVDMFDCILPTAMAQQGLAFTSKGRVDLRRARYRSVEGPLDSACDCYTCKTYAVAYLYHLNRAHESQSWQLLGLHNVHFYMQLTRAMRANILAGTWQTFYQAQRQVLDARDNYGPKSIRYAKVEREKKAQTERMQIGRYEIVVRDDIGRIRDRESGEVMHSVNDPQEEAQSLYVEQSDLIARLQTSGEPLVVWDVGLGAAANAMATIQTCEAMMPHERMRQLRLISFENDLDSLMLALRHRRWFKHLKHAAPEQLLANGRWQSQCGSIDWQLLPGDFATVKFTAPTPDIVFFDPFSFKTDTNLWTLTAFRELLALCGGRATELFTYTYSTAVRSAMLAAGFYVAKGRATGPKQETTIGLSPAAAATDHARELLGSDWLTRWHRSGAQAPLGVAVGDESWREAVVSHPQFQL